jgi:hypothetical protein
MLQPPSHWLGVFSNKADRKRTGKSKEEPGPFNAGAAPLPQNSRLNNLSTLPETYIEAKSGGERNELWPREDGSNLGLLERHQRGIGPSLAGPER